MVDILEILGVVALAVVVLILALGIWNMSKKGAEARTRSNRLMRLRVLAQFIAVIILMLLFYLSGSKPW